LAKEKSTMLVAFKTFILLCFFKVETHEVPYSKSLLFLVAVFFLLLKGVALSHGTAAVAIVVLQLVLYMLFVYVILRFRQMPGRYVQTLLALLGTACVMAVVILPISFLPMNLLPMNLLRMIGLIFLIWHFAVVSHIVKSSLELSTGSAVMITLGFEILRMLITYQVWMWSVAK
jgi:hypothetical protein